MPSFSLGAGKDWREKKPHIQGKILHAVAVIDSCDAADVHVLRCRIRGNMRPDVFELVEDLMKTNIRWCQLIFATRTMEEDFG